MTKETPRSIGCDEYFRHVRKKYAFLTTEYRYRWHEWNTESLPNSSCWITLMSKNMLVSIIRDRGYTEIRFNRIVNGKEDEDEIDLVEIMSELSIPTSWDEYEARYGKSKMKAITQLEYYALILKRNIRKIENTVQNRST